jgi:hypothetical protein
MLPSVHWFTQRDLLCLAAFQLDKKSWYLVICLGNKEFSQYAELYGCYLFKELMESIFTIPYVTLLVLDEWFYLHDEFIGSTKQ